MASTTKAKKTTKTTTATKLPPNPFVFEILDEVSKQSTNAKKLIKTTQSIPTTNTHTPRCSIHSHGTHADARTCTASTRLE